MRQLSTCADIAFLIESSWFGLENLTGQSINKFARAWLSRDYEVKVLALICNLGQIAAMLSHMQQFKELSEIDFCNVP